MAGGNLFPEFLSFSFMENFKSSSCPTGGLIPQDNTNHNKRTLENENNTILKRQAIPINETSFLIVHSESGELSKMSPFFIQKGIKGICGNEPKNIKKLRSGDFLVETKDSRQSQYLLSASAMGNIKISDIVAKNGGITLVKVQAITDNKYGL